MDSIPLLPPPVLPTEEEQVEYVQIQNSFSSGVVTIGKKTYHYITPDR